MSAKPRKKSIAISFVKRSENVFGFLIGHSMGRLLLIGILAAVGLPILTHSIWRDVGPTVLSQADYRISPENIEVTASPTWIRRDVKLDVIDFHLGNKPMSIADDDIAERIMQAFSLHPWIQEVESVQKFYPARVRVELIYRKPVAMVEVEDGDEIGLLPVDVRGVLLPPDDFSPIDARQYPRIKNIRTVPRSEGSAWEDPRVTGSAALAAKIGDDWQRLNLFRIVPSAEPETVYGTSQYTYEIRTRPPSEGRLGTRIIWGSGPAQALPGEVDFDEKMRRLKEYAQKHGSLDDADYAFDLDLRGQQKILKIRRAVMRDKSNQ